MDTELVVVAIAEGEALEEGVLSPAVGKIGSCQSFRTDVVDVAVGGFVIVGTSVFHPVNHVGSVPIESLDLELVEVARVGCAEMPVGALFGLQLERTLQSGTIVVNVCVSRCSETLVEGRKDSPVVGGTPCEVDAGV